MKRTTVVRTLKFLDHPEKATAELATNVITTVRNTRENPLSQNEQFIKRELSSDTKGEDDEFNQVRQVVLHIETLQFHPVLVSGLFEGTTKPRRVSEVVNDGIHGSAAGLDRMRVGLTQGPLVGDASTSR